MTELLGLAGRKFAGKDTFARLLIEEGERRGIRVVRVAFADKLKVSAARALGLAALSDSWRTVRFLDGSDTAAVAMMDRLKEGGRIIVECADDLRWSFSGREFLQWYGTEAHRDVFGPDFWVDALLPLVPGVWEARYEGVDLVVVSDCRFVSEAERIRSLGGKILRIDRDLPDDGDQHASEVPLPTEFIYEAVANDGSLADLEVAAAYWLLTLAGRVDG